MSRLVTCCRHVSRCGAGGSFLRQQQPVLTGLWLTQRAEMSTLDQMFNKIVTAPPVYFIEDTLAHFHDVTGSTRHNYLPR
jgi:hypothetical protein